jgi:hypothetical protein
MRYDQRLMSARLDALIVEKWQVGWIARRLDADTIEIRAPNSPGWRVYSELSASALYERRQAVSAGAIVLYELPEHGPWTDDQWRISRARDEKLPQGTMREQEARGFAICRALSDGAYMAVQRLLTAFGWPFGDALWLNIERELHDRAQPDVARARDYLIDEEGIHHVAASAAALRMFAPLRSMR